MNPIVLVIGWGLVHALWEDLLLALLAEVGFRVLRGRIQQTFLGLCLFLCIGLPIATAVHKLPGHYRRPRLAPTVVTIHQGALATQVRGANAMLLVKSRLEQAIAPHLPVLVLLWALGVAGMGLRLGGGWALGAKWCRRAKEAPKKWQAWLDLQASAAGIRRPIGLRVIPGGSSPLVWGIWKPVVMVPAALLTQLPPPMLEALLAHELAHVRQKDFLWNLFLSLAEVLLFFHPAVWWLSRRIRDGREECADSLAAQWLGEPRRLAQALNALDDLQASLTPSLFPGLAAQGGNLYQRIQRLILPPVTARPHRSFWTALLVLPVLALALRAAVPPKARTRIGTSAPVLSKLDAVAAEVGVDPGLLRRLAFVRSMFNPDLTQPGGRSGLLQVSPRVAQAYGAKNLQDPDQVLVAGARYFRTLLERYPEDQAKAIGVFCIGEHALEVASGPLVASLAQQVQNADVEPQTGLADGEVQAIVLRQEECLMVQMKIRCQGNLKVHLSPDGGDVDAGDVAIGMAHPDGTFEKGPWIEFEPSIVLPVRKPASRLKVKCVDPGTGWEGETWVTLDSPLKNCTFLMKPKA
jgi:bla regulator protein blaR1